MSGHVAQLARRVEDEGRLDVAALVATMSPARLDGWFRCQQQWWFIYVEGRRRPPNGPIIYGRAFDAATDSTYLSKKVHGETPLPKVAAEFYAAGFEREVALSGGVDWGETTAAKLKDHGAWLAREWAARIAPHVTPREVQKSIVSYLEADADQRLENEAAGIDAGVELRGNVDLVGDAPVALAAETQKLHEPTGARAAVVIDHKTSGKRWSAESATRSTQAMVYALAEHVDHVQFHVGVRTKIPGLQVVPRAVTPSDKRFIVRSIFTARRQIAHAIRSGDVLPNRQSLLCSQTWCGFWRECVERHGGVVPE